MKDKIFLVKIRYTETGLGVGVEGYGTIDPFECTMIVNQFSNMVLGANKKEFTVEEKK